MLLCLPVKVCKDYLALKHQGPHLHAEPIAVRPLLNVCSPVRLLSLLGMKASGNARFTSCRHTSHRAVHLTRHDKASVCGLGTFTPPRRFTLAGHFIRSTWRGPGT